MVEVRRSPASLVSVALVLIVTLGSNALANPPDTEFTANISCLDASRQNDQASIDCQSCSAFYSNDGNTMADVSVEVNGTPGGDGSLIGCDSDGGGQRHQYEWVQRERAGQLRHRFNCTKRRRESIRHYQWRRELHRKRGQRRGDVRRMSILRRRGRPPFR